MREYRPLIITATVGVAFLVWWGWFLRVDGDVNALVNRTGISLFGDSLDRKARSLSGWNSKNCARVPTIGGHDDVTGCALTAFGDHRPFRVRYDIQGLDSVLSVALVSGKTGEMSMLLIDDFSSGTKWGQSVQVRACPSPAVLNTTKLGRLTCYPEGETPYR